MSIHSVNMDPETDRPDAMESIATAKDAEYKLKWYQQFFAYFHLLFAASPMRLDVSLLIIGVLAAIISGVPFPLLAILFGQVIDDLNGASCLTAASSAVPATYQDDVNSKVLIIIYLAIAQFIATYVHLTCWSLVGARLAQRLREEYLRNILKQEPAFFDTLPAGEVSSRLDSDVQTIRAGTSEKVGICISSFSFFVTAYVVALIKQKELAGMLASLIPAYFLMSLIGTHYIEKFAAAMSKGVASATAVASEALSNMVVVHAFGAERRLEVKLSEGLLEARTEGIKKAIVTGIQSGLIYFIAYGANGLAFWQGSRSIADALDRNGTGTTVGAIYTVIFVLVDATLIMSQVAPFVQYFGAATGAFQKLHRDFSRTSKLDGTVDGRDISSIHGSITFNDVSFAYPARPDQIVLKNASVSFPAGKHTALVGLSGSGKSTIAGLISRLYAPSAGDILIDGQDISSLNIRQLRSEISLIQQEPALLNRSIFENIALGLLNSTSPEYAEIRELLLTSAPADFARSLRESPTRDIVARAKTWSAPMTQLTTFVQAAAVRADADSFIERLHHGYGSLAGQGGKLLSGGQRQRCAVARGIIKSPKILILDEATSALDSASEQRVVRAIEALESSKTVISIAHRLSTVRNADNIIVLRDGVVLQQGSHEQLMAEGGAYADLVVLQNMQAEKPGGNMHNKGNMVAETAKTTKITSGTPEESKAGSMTKQKIVTSPSSTSENDESESEGIDSTRSLWSIAKGLGKMLRRDALIALIALIASIIVGSAYSAEAVIFGNTVSSLNTCNTADRIRSAGSFFGLMFLVLAIIEFFANLVSWSGFGFIAEKLLFRVRTGTFKALMRQDLHWHQSSGRSPAKLLSIITRDGTALGGLSGSVIGTILSILVNLIAAIVLTVIIAWKIALVCIATVPLLLGAGLMELRVLTLFEEKHESAYSSSVAVAVEAIGSIKTVAALSLEHEILATYKRALAGPKRQTTQMAFQACLWLATTYFIGTLSYALTFWWGSKQIIEGNYNQTQFLIVVMSLLVSAQLWGQMFALAPELTSAKAAVARILNLLDLHAEEPTAYPIDETRLDQHDEEKTAFIPAASREILPGLGVQFEDVNFAYPSQPDNEVLQNFTLDIQPGQFAALVGPSGAGKSTIVSLLERFYTPTSGSIKLDHFDITKTTGIAFRDNIALVPQDSALFEGSVKFNVGLGARSDQVITDSEIEAACRIARLHERIVRLPQGYDTPCGNNGGMLSGGERQRLAIARALVRKPRLLILDESTSALDAESEKLLQDGLNSARDGITVLAIAHRLNTIRKADVIFMIEGGRVIDRGTHEELFARNEGYRTNALHQMA